MERLFNYSGQFIEDKTVEIRVNSSVVIVYPLLLTLTGMCRDPIDEEEPTSED